MTEAPWTNRIYGALRHPDEAAVLLVPVDGTWTLPAVSLEEVWLSSMGKIVPAFAGLLELPVWGLRQFHYLRDGETRRMEMIVELERIDGSRVLPDGGRWAGAAEIERIGLAAETPFIPLVRYLRELEAGAVPPQRPPWARPGWLPGVRRWITAALGGQGVRVLEIKPFKQWGISCVLHVLTDAGDFYFKTTNRNMPLFVNEALMTVFLAERFPGAVPRPVAAEPGEDWMLLAAFTETFTTKATPELWTAIFERFARLQIQSIPLVNELLSAGAIDRRLPVLAVQIEQLLADPGATALLESPDRVRIQAMLPLFRWMIARLTGFGIPDALVHGDMHLGNAARIDNRLVFFDWTDAAIAPPFFDLMSLGWLDLDAVAGPLTAYLEVWKEFLPYENLDEAVLLARVLLNLHHAVSYQYIVKHLEPDSRIELNETHWFLLEAAGKADEYLSRFPKANL
jgi:hypothetical protein